MIFCLFFSAQVRTRVYTCTTRVRTRVGTGTSTGTEFYSGLSLFGTKMFGVILLTIYRPRTGIKEWIFHGKSCLFMGAAIHHFITPCVCCVKMGVQTARYLATQRQGGYFYPGTYHICDHT